MITPYSIDITGAGGNRNMMRRCFFAAFLCFFLLLSGCSGQSQNNISRYDIPAPIANLDPQYAMESSAHMIIRNLYEGLLIQAPDGTLHPGAAESWNISGDGLTYTFTLRDGLVWPDKESTPITAQDFQFAFERMFNPSSPSPYAMNYSAIQNAGKILAGQEALSSLGVQSRDNTLTFSLDRPDPQLLQRLSEPPAMPCSRSFFNECRGRYGLEKNYVLGNGPFRISGWNNQKSILLRRNEQYLSELPAVAEGVDFYIAREEPAKLLEDGKADLAEVDSVEVANLSRKGMNIFPYNKSVWCIALRADDPVWKMVLLRQALAISLDRSVMEESLSYGFAVTDNLVTTELLLADQPYDSFKKTVRSPEYNYANAVSYFSDGLSALDLPKMPATEILIPDDDMHVLLIGHVQRAWQRGLGFFPNIRRLDEATLESRFYSGDYQIMLIPITTSSSQVSDMLAGFLSENSFGGYRNIFYDSFYRDAALAPTLPEAAIGYAHAQSQLLFDAALIPLYRETGYYALSPGWEGFWIYPQNGCVYFKYAQYTG